MNPMKFRPRTAKTILIAVFGLGLAQTGQALQLSENSLPIVTQDTVAPATGTLTLLGLSDTLPPGAQTVAGSFATGEVVLQVQASLSAGSLYSLTGLVVKSDDPQPGGGDFCCIQASGYLADSQRLPGPDEFWPWIWNWFFDDVADPGLLSAGESADLWVSMSPLEPGDQILFFASGPSPEPCPGGQCPPLGHVTVIADTAPALSPPAALTLGLLISGTALGLGSRLRKGKPGPAS